MQSVSKSMKQTSETKFAKMTTKSTNFWKYTKNGENKFNIDPRTKRRGTMSN